MPDQDSCRLSHLHLIRCGIGSKDKRVSLVRLSTCFQNVFNRWAPVKEAGLYHEEKG